jgi:hypothetical protein
VKHAKTPDAPQPTTPPVGPFQRLANFLRNSRRVEAFHRVSAKKAVPALAALVALYVVTGAGYRLAFHLPNVGDGVCTKWFDAHDGAGASPDPARWGEKIEIDTRVPCQHTGLRLQADQRYAIEVDVQEDWKDDQHPAGIDGLSGYRHLLRPQFVAGVPSRRSLLLPWYTLTGEIGRDSGHAFPINRDHFILKPKRSGFLYVYVNDAINGLGGRLGFGSEAWDEYYANNVGTATITITELP